MPNNPISISELDLAGSIDRNDQFLFVVYDSDGNPVVTQRVPLNEIDITLLQQGLSADLNFGNFSATNIDHIDFRLDSVTTHNEGRLDWNEDDKTLEYHTEVSGVRLQIGQELLLRAANKTGNTIENGAVVYVSGATGSRPEISLADATTALSSDTTIGIATQNIQNNRTGYVTSFGLARDFDTSAFNKGDVVYVSSTAGKLTNTEPQPPNYSIKVGTVVRSNATEGVVLVNVQNPKLAKVEGDARYVKLNGENLDVRTVTTDTTLDDTYNTVLVDTSSGAIDITLPSASGLSGRVYNVKLIGSQKMTVTAGDLIDGSSSIEVTRKYDSVQLQTDGSTWHII